MTLDAWVWSFAAFNILWSVVNVFNAWQNVRGARVNIEIARDMTDLVRMLRAREQGDTNKAVQLMARIEKRVATKAEQ
jgi:hypothetical protein